MATKKDSEVEKSEDLLLEVNVGELVNAEDPVKEVILAVMKILLRHLLNRLSELEGLPADMARFAPSFKACWQEWKKQDGQQEESSFVVFLNTMIADTETLWERLCFVFISITCCCFQSLLDCQYLGEWGKIDTWILVRLCGNKSWREKNVWLFFFVGLMLKKSEVESRDKCISLELAPVPGTIILSLRTSHPINIYFYSVLYRTRNGLFSSIWDPDSFF